MFTKGRLLLIIGASVLLSLFIIPKLLSSVREDGEAVIQISAVDFSAVPDGTYSGDFEQAGLSVSLNVTFISGQMLGIAVQSEQGIPRERMDKVCNAVIDMQTLTIDDGDLGAQTCDRVLLKAMENAISGASGLV